MSKTLLGNNEIFDDVMTLTFLRRHTYFRLFGEKKVENPNFFVFHPISSKFGTGGNFEMLVTKIKPKLKLEIDLSKNRNFRPILAKIIPSTLQQ